MTSATSISRGSTGCPCFPSSPPAAPIPATFEVGTEAFVEKEGDNTVLINSDFLDGMSVPEAKEEIAKRMENMGIGERKVNFRLRDWACRASATGAAPSRSSLRRLRHRAGAEAVAPRDAAGGRDLRQAGQPARAPPDLEARRLPILRQARAPRDGHLRHLHRLVLVLCPLLLAPCAGAGGHGGREVLDGCRPVHRRRRARDPASPLFALLRPRHDGDGPSRNQGALREPVHARHGHP